MKNLDNFTTLVKQQGYDICFSVTDNMFVARAPATHQTAFFVPRSVAEAIDKAILQAAL